MTFREKRDHKFKILFTYYVSQNDIDDILFNYFDNIPYEEEDDENNYINKDSRKHESIAKILLKEEDKYENVSDNGVVINLSDSDNINDIKNKVKFIIDKTNEIDNLVKDCLLSWDINRIGKAELTIIRLAVYEMYFDNSIDIPVAINEAVELAKTYCDEKADKFVNGVLSTIYKKKSEK